MKRLLLNFALVCLTAATLACAGPTNTAVTAGAGSGGASMLAVQPQGDWSYSLGSTAGASVAPYNFPAKYTYDTTAAPSCSNDFVVFAVNQPGSASQASIVAFNNLYSGPAIAASQTGSFTAQPLSTDSISITNGSNTLKLTAQSGSPATPWDQTGTFTGKATGGSSITITHNSTTLSLTQTGSGTQSDCTGQSGSTINSTFYNGGNSTTAEATSFAQAVNICSNLYPQLGFSATSSGTGVTVTATLAGGSDSAGTYSTSTTWGAGTFTWGTATAGSDGSNNGCSSATTGSYATSASTSTLATNLATAINACNSKYSAVGVTAGSSGSTVTVSAATAGSAGNSIAVSKSSSAFSWAGAKLVGGTAAGLCGTGSPTVLWAYNTGTTPILTSPILSLDGTKVAYVERGVAGSGAILHVLRWQSGEGTPGAPATPAQSISSGSCSGTSSCVFSLLYTGSQNHTNSNSSPFYDFTRGTDSLYVGDDGGLLWKVAASSTARPR